MTIVRIDLRCVLLALSAAFLAACSGAGDHTSDSSSGTQGAPMPASSAAVQPPHPTLTDSSLQPPPLHNQYTTSGRPDVVFDPCTWISDSAIQKAGFDPDSRKRGKDVVAEYTFLVCHYDSKLRYVTVSSGNITYEEDQQKNGSWLHSTTINGRQASFGRDASSGISTTCEVHMRTKVGVVFVTVLLTDDGVAQGMNACDGIQGIASAIEPEIGKGN